MSVGALRNTYGKIALVSVSALRRLWRLEAHGASGAPGAAPRSASRGERCGELVWQLLSRASLSGTAVEPVPFALGDAPRPDVAYTGAESAPGSCTDASSCVEVMALRSLLSRRVATAGERLAVMPYAARRANRTSQWAPDALDMASVLAAMQHLVNPPQR